MYVFLTRIAAQGASRFAGQASHWTPVIPTIITVSLLAVLSIAALSAIVKLIVAQPNHSRTTESNGRTKTAYAAGPLRRSRWIAKGRY
jgi:hypothetical protein